MLILISCFIFVASLRQTSSQDRVSADEVLVESSSEGISQFEADGDSRVLFGRMLRKGKYWVARGVPSATTTLKLDKNYSTFLATFGATGSLARNSGTITLEGDGKRLAKYDVDSWMPPVNAAIDVSAVTNLKMIITSFACVVNPQLSRTTLVSPKLFECEEPRDGSTIRGSTIVLRWTPISQAKRYVVTIVSRSNPRVGTKPDCWLIESQTPNATIHVTDEMQGWYSWSVWAYDGAAPIAAQDERSPGRFYVPGPHKSIDSPSSTPEWHPITKAWSERDSDNNTPQNWTHQRLDEPIFFAVRNRSGFPDGRYIAHIEIPDRPCSLRVGLRPSSIGADVLILADGKRLGSLGSPPSGSKPRSIEFALTGGQTITLVAANLGNIGDQLRLDEVQLALSELPRPKLDQPNEDKRFDEGQTLQWNPLPGASRYALRIDLLRLDETPRERSGTNFMLESANDETEVKLRMAGKPKGWYQWKVIGFGPEGVIGTWSEPRRFHWVGK